MRIFALTLLLLLLPASAAAQVYKCKGKSGETVYSEHPCDARAEPMKLRESAVSAPAPQQPAVSEGEHEGAGEGEQATAPANSEELARARDAERSCISTATASIYGSSNDRVGTLQQQMGMLNEQLAAAQDAQRSKALRERMATFRQAISREHASAHAQMNTARRACVQQHRPGAAAAR